MKGLKYKINKKISKHESDRIMKNGILLGCHQGLSKKDLDYMLEKLKSFIYKLK